MLTTKDRIWLKNRERRITIGHPYYSCAHCRYWKADEKHECANSTWILDGDYSEVYCHLCEILGEFFDAPKDFVEVYDHSPEFRDAAEFEARVAAQVSDWAADGFFSDCEFCLYNNECMDGSKLPCRWYIIKDARLAVEEEIDG